MTVAVMGFHKSGTTLVARTLHEAGIDMGTTCEGGYPKCKYEDPRASAICRQILYGGHRRRSYDPPTTYNNRRDLIRHYVAMRLTELRPADGEPLPDWGLKVPDLTLCWPQWAPEMPEDTVAVAVMRDIVDVVAHYQRRRHPVDPEVVKQANSRYWARIIEAGIPVVHYERFIRGDHYPLDALLGRDLPDCRDPAKIPKKS